MESPTMQYATGISPSPVAPATTPSTGKPAVAVEAAQPIGDRNKAVARESSTPERDSRSLKYLVQEGRIITMIVDDQSKDVVVQIPDAELVRLAKAIDRMQGFFIEQKA